MNSDEIINSIIKPFVVEQPYEVPGEFYMSSSSNINQRIMSEYETLRFPKCCADCLFAMIDDPDMGDFTCIYKAWPKEIDSEIAYIKRPGWCELE
jgi:hypothetical protein